MKISNSSTVRLFCFLTVFFISGSIHSQQFIIWKGGTPGQENAWECTKNWSKCRVPDEFSNVVIPDVSTASNCPPVIQKGTVQVNTLFVESNANFHISDNAQLLVENFLEGIENITGHVVLLNEPITDPHAAAEVRKQNN